MSDNTDTTLRTEIRNIYDNPDEPEYCLQDLISDKAIDQIVDLLAHKVQQADTNGRIDEIQTLLSTYEIAKDLMYAELKKHGFETSIAIRSVELLISNMKDRLTALKEEDN